MNTQEQQHNWHIVLTTVSTPLFTSAVFSLFVICGLAIEALNGTSFLNSL